MRLGGRLKADRFVPDEVRFGCCRGLPEGLGIDGTRERRLLSSRIVTSLVLAASLGAATTLPVAAGLTRQEIATAGFHLKAGSTLPAMVALRDDAGETTLGAALNGKPALLVFTDYRCQSLCGIVLDELSETLPKVPLALGRDFNVLSVALDSSETAAEAAAFRDRHTGGSVLHDRGRFFTEDAASLQALKESVGLVAPYDADHKQFAHPAGLVLVDAGGHAKRVVTPFALDPLDLKLALTETGPGAATLAGHLLTLCYAFDPVSGIYTLRILRILSAAAGMTVILMAGGVLLFLRQERRLRRRLADDGVI